MKLFLKMDSLKLVPLEQALELTGFGRYNYVLFAVSNYFLLIMVLNTFGVSLTVTASSCELELNTHTKGIIACMPMLGIVLSAYLWGWLADTRGRRWVLLIALWGTCVFTLLGSFSTLWEMLAVTKFFGSFFVSAANNVTYALFGECTPRSKRNRMLLMLSSGLMCGQGFMAVLAYPVLMSNLNFKIPMLNVKYLPWRTLEQVYAATAGLGALILLKTIKESPKFYASRGRDDECLKVLREIYVSNTGRKADEYPVSSILFEETVINTKDTSIVKSLVQQTLPLFRPPLRNNTLIISYIVIVVYVVSPSFLIWMPTITNAFSRAVATGIADESFCRIIHADMNLTLHGSEKKTCIDTVENFTFMALIAFSCVLATLNTMNALLLKFMSKRTLLIFYNGVTGISGLLLPFIYSNAISAVLFFIFVLNLLCMGIMTSFTVELYPTYLRAMAVCLTVMIGRGCSLISIRYTGILMESYCEETFLTYGLFVLSAALVSLLLPNDVDTYSQRSG